MQMHTLLSKMFPYFHMEIHTMSLNIIWNNDVNKLVVGFSEKQWNQDWDFHITNNCDSHQMSTNHLDFFTSSASSQIKLSLILRGILSVGKRRTKNQSMHVFHSLLTCIYLWLCWTRDLSRSVLYFTSLLLKISNKK